jgi:lysophospholipid acyltransferase (LPLAT)-like uncharacterized protein
MRPLRNPVVQKILSVLLAGWLKFCYATIRWEHENQPLAEQVWKDGGGVLLAFWHSRLSLGIASWPQDRAQPAKAMISLSSDGEFLAKAIARLGIPAVRGSAANKDKEKLKASKGGTHALRDGLKQLKVGALALTPDGPRGPARTMAEGLPVMARISGAPVMFIGLSCNPAIRLNSWDKGLIPLPFGKGAIVWEQVYFPEGGDVTEVAKAWTERLNRVEARADALTGLEPR